ncbi:MAG: DUF4252 domain-containing protein [Acidobacteriota bacterium]
MKSFINHSFKIFVLLLFVITVTKAQDARLNLDRLKGLETKAKDVVEVNIDGKVLDLAKRVMLKVNDKDAKTIGEAIKGLKGIYVRVYNFEKENEYNLTDIDEIRSQLQSPDWEKIANVRSKKNNQKIDVFTKFTGDMMSGVAVVLSESKSLAVVNVVGPIDIDTLVELSGRMNIPKIDIEKETTKKPDEQE